MDDVHYDAFLQWVHAGDDLGNDSAGHSSPAYDSFFPGNRPSPTVQSFRRTFGTSPYPLQGNNFIPAWTGYSERRIRRGTGAFIPTYNQCQVMDRRYPLQEGNFFWWHHNGLVVDGLERRRRGTGVFHPRLVTESVNSNATAKNSTSGLGQNRDTDNEDVAQKIVHTDPVDYPDSVLQELGLLLERPY